MGCSFGGTIEIRAGEQGGLGKLGKKITPVNQIIKGGRKTLLKRK